MNLILYIIKILGILIHPLNSWGWPISINLNTKYSILDLSLNLKLFFKILLFFYRVLLFYSFFKNIYSITQKISIKNIFSKNNLITLSENSLQFSTFGLLSLNIFLYIGLFGFLEHRYFYPIMPWIEFSVFSKNLISNNNY